MAQIKADQVIDIKGLNCPLPVLKTKRALDFLKPGQILKVVATDPAVKKDIPALLERLGDELLSTEEQEGEVVFYIKKKKEED
ncbi:MAG: sulfurtransferase TusA family protein [Nitrospirae bacterium]|nr:MAG: sulfurtransferase TusA family protein [Nitrospirota bacterium]